MLSQDSATSISSLETFIDHKHEDVIEENFVKVSNPEEVNRLIHVSMQSIGKMVVVKKMLLRFLI